MQVKKFEARTMKEALEMVKTQLGPDAIILSVRDNNRSFGLVGEGSVEITAAVSEDTLQKKKFAESRLREEDKQRLLRSPAKVQKQVINQMVHKYVAEKEERLGRPITRTRYIDIDDGGAGQTQAQEELLPNPQAAAERIKNAAQRAWATMHQQGTWEELKRSSIPLRSAAPAAPPAETARAGAKTLPQKPATAVAETAEISALKGEIASLKQVIAQFQQIPQSLSTGQHPGASYGLSYDCAVTFEKLVAAGIAEDISAEILLQAQEQMPALKLKNKALLEAFAAKSIMNSTLIWNDRQSSKIHVFVGPAASGKTSTLIKMASHLVVRDGKKVALVTTDTLKVGAADQMRIYAQILNVPFAVVRQRGDWEKIMAALSSYDHILVDFSGLSLKNMEEISFVRNLLPPDHLNPQIHLVLSCLAKDSDLTEIGKRYKVTAFQNVIFTSLDESVQHGTIYNFMKRFSVPLHSFGIGTRVPEDFEVATKERVLDLIFKITKMNRTANEGAVS
jgi:flagellar biosynthesis protein FlhF